MDAVGLEFGVAAHVDDATLAWVDAPRWWGLCGQGVEEASAFEDLSARAMPSYLRFLARHGETAPSLPPSGFSTGWHTATPTPGEIGPAFLAGHVDWGGRPGAFLRPAGADAR